MFPMFCYRKWRLHPRPSEEGVWDCLVLSPYNHPTTATRGGSCVEAVQKARKEVDRLIREHYPPGRHGRYGPPTQFQPKPGQPRGWRVLSGRQRLPESEAREVAKRAAQSPLSDTRI